MTKFERDELARLNRAMDQYRDALKKLVDAIDLDDHGVSSRCEPALNAARELLK